MRQNEARIRAILENTQVGLLTLDGGGRVEFVNGKALELLGYAEQEMKWMRFVDCFEHKARTRVEATLGREGPVVTLEEVEGGRGDGSVIPVEVSIGTLRLAGGCKRLVTLHDIRFLKRQEAELRQARDRLEERTRDLVATNRRLVREIDEHRGTELALRQTQDELIQAAKMAALGQMSTGISHELNQPLAAIRSYADNARALIGKQRLEDADWNLEQIAGLTQRMAQISAPR